MPGRKRRSVPRSPTVLASVRSSQSATRTCWRVIAWRRSPRISSVGRRVEEVVAGGRPVTSGQDIPMTLVIDQIQRVGPCQGAGGNCEGTFAGHRRIYETYDMTDKGPSYFHAAVGEMAKRRHRTDRDLMPPQPSMPTMRKPTARSFITNRLATHSKFAGIAPFNSQA